MIAIIKYVAKYFLPITFFVSGVSFVLQAADQSKRVNVLVWDEQQPEQKKAYPNFLGNAIANHLTLNSDLNVKSVKLDDPEQGISAKVLDWSDVIVWWGHVRHDEISVEKSKDIVRRIKQGDLSLIALHSAHWSNPFVEAMNERTRLDFDRDYANWGTVV